MSKRKRPPPTKEEEFQTLKTVWYRKLERSGFEDIESDEDHLKQWSSKFSRPSSMTSYQAKSEYYYMATQFLNNNKFESKFHEIVWTYHSGGMSLRNIVKTLNKVKKDRTSISKIRDIVDKLVDQMKTQYLPGYKNE